MPARTPDEICGLFRQYMHDGDLDAVMTLYDREAVFVNQAAELSSGPEMLRSELAPFAAAKATFEFTSIQIIQADNIALMHTAWNVTGPDYREPGLRM
jgi:ketosteroid isomerase-like protein